MKFKYSFSVLRYVHDPVTQEFVNVGIALFSPEAGYLRSMCTTSYARVSQLFERIDGARFRQMSRYVQERVSAMGREWENRLPFNSDERIETILSTVLPPDDSSFQFSRPGVGLSSNLDLTLQELYRRHVECYTLQGEGPRRTDEDVWKRFREPLDRVHVTPRLNPKRIIAPSYEYDFQRSWKNEIWHVLEPVSFDMVDAGSMLDKANRWVGRATSLMESSESFEIHMLLGEPTDNRLCATFIKAQNILNKMPGRKVFVKESEADSFAEELAREIELHAGD